MLVKPYSKKLLAVAVAAALSVPVVANDVTVIQSVSPEISGQVAADTSVKQKSLQQEFPNYFIVQLESAPLAAVAVNPENQTEDKLGNRLDLSSETAQKHANVLAAERATFEQNLKAALPDAKIDRHFDTVLNAVVVTSTEDVFEQLKTLEGVSNVYREQMYYEQMDASLDLIKAKAVWEQMGGDANAGKGVKVAVIDGGIRPENPLFRDEGMAAPSSKPTNDYCATTEPAFCNNKLIAARYSVPTFATVPQEYMSPLGNGGHGTHTAGTAVGVPTKVWFNGSTNIVPVVDGTEVKNGFTEVTVSGVAPGAYLMSYKALFQVVGPNGVTGSGSNVMLIEALDWAVKDGADVINNSWGGSAGADPATSPYQAAFKTAEDAGVVVVTSAGNSGPGAQTVGCPSCIESGISVASTTTGRFFANSVTVAGGQPLLAIPGSTFTATVSGLTEDPKAKVIDAAVVASSNALGCNAFAADTFKDSFAMISRGTCAFSVKINNAMAAGAKGVIIVQNNDGQPTSMASDGTTIPNVMITRADAAKVSAAITADPNAEVTISRFASKIINPQFVDNMSDFSSRGPNGNNNILKPDMGAPGGSILSATSPDAFSDARTFQLMSGTSMAAPHVAGAAAIMQQKFPKWTAVEIKTALTSTAVNGLKKEDSISATTPFDIGAGRLDVSRAVQAAVTFDKPSFAQNPCVGACNFTRTIRNMTDKEVTWTGAVQFTDNGTTGTLDKTSITLKPYGTPGDTAEFVLAVDSTLSAYNAWSFGNVVWTSSDAAAPTANMPIAIRAAATADVTTTSTAASVVMTPTVPTLVTNSFGNKTFGGQVVISAKAPAGTKITKGSEAATLSGATEYLLDNNPVTNTVSWTGMVNKPLVALGTGTPQATSIKTLGVAAANCTGECDDNVISYNLASFPMTFNGVTYTRLHVSTNGFVQLSNSATPPSASAANVRLPSTTAPTNLFAPFWTDLDLTGGATGAGTLHVGLIALNGRNYVVVEWNGVEEYSVSANKYTFQIWIATSGAEDIFYNYVDVPATPSALTVGVQDISRTLGMSTYFASETSLATGTLPTTGSATRVNTTPGGRVDVSYNLELSGAMELGVADTIATDEDTASAGADVLANEKTSGNKVIEMTVKSGTETLKAYNKAAFQPAGALSDVSIVSQGMNGTAAVVDGLVVYTPKANFNGKDSFTYTAKDSAGNTIVPTKVSVTVASVNDKPVVTMPETVKVKSGKPATLTVNGMDVDGDALTYKWTKTSTVGSDIPATTTAATVNVTTPEVAANTDITYSVVANDGKLDSDPVTVTLTVENAAPTLVAGGPFTVNSGKAVNLNVVGTDLDGDNLTYTWTKTSTAGTDITAKTASVSVTAPEVASDTTVTYSVVASDGKVSSAPVTVTLTVKNTAPTLTAGAAVTVNEGQNATLSVVGADAEGDTLTYTWTKTSTAGNAITAKTATVTVAAPEVTADGAVTYSVVASDGKVSSAPVTVTLNVKNVPEPDVEKGGGSMGFLSLLLLPLAMLRRRFK